MMIEVDKLMEMDVLLRLAWTAATLPILIALIPSSSLHSFHRIMSGFAQRGKNMHSSSTRFTVPQKFFGHFYVIAVVWTTLLLVVNWCYAYKSTNEQSKVSFLWAGFTSDDVMQSLACCERTKHKLKPIQFLKVIGLIMFHLLTTWQKLLYMVVFWLLVDARISQSGHFLHLWLQIFHLQRQKHIDGIFGNLRTIPATVWSLYHLFTNVNVIIYASCVTCRYVHRVVTE